MTANSLIDESQSTSIVLVYQFNIVAKWSIEGFDLYFIDDKNKVRNITTGRPVKMQLKGYTRGYYLSGKFYSLKQLRPLLKKYRQEKMPF